MANMRYYVEKHFSVPSMNISNDSASILSGINTHPVGDTYRGIGGDWFNAENIAKEDFARQEQQANNAFLRDMYQQMYNNEFNALEAQKQRDFEERLAGSQYQRAVQDLKLAGLNPILAYSQGGNVVPQGSAAVAQTVSSGRSSNYYGKRANTGEFLSAVSNVVMSLVNGFTGLVNVGLKASQLANVKRR